MQRSRPVGRAGVRQYRGRAQVTHARDHESAGADPAKTNILAVMLTNVFKVDRPEPPPVFVDESGQRRRRVRRLAFLVIAVTVALLVTVWLTQLGEAVRPGPVSPCGEPSAAVSPSAPAGCGR
jgi:hypothetical protein